MIGPGKTVRWSLFGVAAVLSCGSPPSTADTSAAGRGGESTTVEPSGGVGGGLPGPAAGAAGALIATGGAPSTATDVQRLAAAFCATARACCASDPMDSLRNCEGQVVGERPLVWVTEGSIALDKTKLSGCIAALQAAIPSCARRPIDAACRGVVTVPKRVGEPCLLSRADYECGADGPGSACVEETRGTLGVCRKFAHAASGQACNFECTNANGCPTTYVAIPFGETFTGCFESDGLECDLGFESPAICKPPVARGSACQLSSQCAVGDDCRADAGGQQTCQAPLKLGDRCLLTCGGLSCDAGTCSEPRFGVGFGDNSCFAHFPNFSLNLL